MSVPALRWLALVLVLLNLAYYWYASNVETAEPLAPTPVLGAQRLLLLAEAAGQQENATLPDTGSPGAERNSAGFETLRCWELGPLGKDLQNDLSDLFERLGMSMRSVRRREVDATDYRVYLAVNEPEMRADYQRQLDAVGVESYVIGGGELEGNISLGVFTSRERAEAVAKPLQTQKLPVVIHSRQQRQDQTWLRVDSREVAALGWSADLADLTLWPRPGILAVDCKETDLSPPLD